MNKSLYFGLAMLCLPAPLLSQVGTESSRTVLKLSPQHFITNSLKAGIERFNKNRSASLAFFLTGMIENDNDYSFYEAYNGLAGEVQVRKYVSPMKGYTSKSGKVYYQGIYVAGYAQCGSYSGDFNDDFGHFDPATGMHVPEYFVYHKSVSNYGLGFIMGYQKTLWQVIFLEAFVGGGIQLADEIVTGHPPDRDYYDFGITTPGYNGALPKIGLTIGIGL